MSDQIRMSMPAVFIPPQRLNHFLALESFVDICVHVKGTGACMNISSMYIHTYILFLPDIIHQYTMAAENQSLPNKDYH